MQVHSLFTGLACVYLLESESGLFLVDAGFAGLERAILKRMNDLGREDLRLIFITHAHLDHYGSAAALRRQTGAVIAVHQADAGFMARGESPLGSTRGRGRLVGLFFPLLERLLGPQPTPPDLVLQDGDSLEAYGLPARLLHTPGHTPGSSCLLVQGGLAFAGDLISSTLTFHAQRFYAHDWSLIPASLARLAEQRPGKIYSGHGRKALGLGALQKLVAEAAVERKYKNQASRSTS